MGVQEKVKSKVKYHLIQHTPIIHFQHYEDGACLRASEVKPFLDRFIVNQVIKENKLKNKDYSLDIMRNEYKNWFLPLDLKEGSDNSAESIAKKYALNYKLSIVALGETEISQDLENIRARKNYKSIEKSYFGNMVNKNELKKSDEELYYQGIKETVYYPGGCTLVRICFIAELAAKIDDLLPAFFALHNFGTRSNKGFGSFTVDKKEEKALEINYSDIYKNYNSGTHFFRTDNALKSINLVYGFMKSGFNYTGNGSECNYVKGYIFRYFLNQDIHSEKRMVKNYIIVNTPENLKYKYVRGLLGINDGVNYRINKRNEPVNVVTRSTSGKIERFNSPILFKPIGKTVYIIPRDMPDEILNAEFEFFEKKNEKNSQKCATPDKFNLVDFLNQFCNDFNDKDKEIGKTKDGNESITINKLEHFELKEAKKIQIMSVCSREENNG